MCGLWLGQQLLPLIFGNSLHDFSCFAYPFSMTSDNAPKYQSHCYQVTKPSVCDRLSLVVREEDIPGAQQRRAGRSG